MNVGPVSGHAFCFSQDQLTVRRRHFVFGVHSVEYLGIDMSTIALCDSMGCNKASTV